jgi:hypothetical protein
MKNKTTSKRNKYKKICIETPEQRAKRFIQEKEEEERQQNP